MKQDFIIRMIETFFEFLAKSLNLFQKKEIVQAEQSIGLAFRQFLGYPQVFIESQSVSSLIGLFQSDPEKAKVRVFIAAELFRCQAMILKEQSESKKADDALRKSVELFLRGSEIPGPPEPDEFLPSIRLLLEEEDGGEALSVDDRTNLKMLLGIA